MSKYLFRSWYTPEGAKGLIEYGGTSWRAESERAVASVGPASLNPSTTRSAQPMFIIANLPDNASAASLNLGGAASGAIDSEPVGFPHPEEIDDAEKSPAYRPPRAS
jgi:hypothetical protein